MMTGFAHELTGRPWPGYDDGRPLCRCRPDGRWADSPEDICEVCEDAREWAEFCALAEAHMRDPDDDDQPATAENRPSVRAISEQDEMAQDEQNQTPTTETEGR